LIVALRSVRFCAAIFSMALSAQNIRMSRSLKAVKKIKNS